MPVQPPLPFLNITCPSCGWNTVIRQRSDAVICPPVCPACGHENLSRSSSGAVQSLLSHPVASLQAVLKNRNKRGV